jgi:drug/metabolite transporter (DMT)-like permease
MATTPPRHVYLFLAAGLLAASQSGNIIRLGDAHPAAIAAFRLLLASAVLVPLAGRRLTLLGRLGRGDRALLVFAGVALAAHFLTWIAAVQRTTVANAATFFAINPVITATFGYLIFREPVSWRLAVAVVLGVAGVATMGWGHLTLTGEHLAGDGLALLCSLLFTAYFLAGKRLRRTLPTSVYVAVVYGIAAAASFALALALGVPLTGYDGRTWLCFVLMAVGPTLIGHTSFNYALAHLKASWISTSTLTEPLAAALVAWLAWGETMTAAGIAGYGLICLSVVALLRERSSLDDASPPEPTKVAAPEAAT